MKIFDIQHNFNARLQEGQWTTSQGKAANTRRNCLEGDTINVRFGLLTAVSLSGRQCDSMERVR